MWLNPQFPEDLATFTKEILNGKLHFLCSENLAALLEHLAHYSLFLYNVAATLF